MTASENGDVDILRARVEGRPGLVDVRVRSGRIVAIEPSAAPGMDAAGMDAAGIDAAGIDAAGIDAAGIDAAGGMLIPPFAEPHTHPDKVFSRELISQLGSAYARNRAARMQRQRDLKARFTRDDVAVRAVRLLQDCALGGIGVVAGQADIDSITGLTSVEGVLDARERARDWIDLVVTAFPQEGLVGDPRAHDLVADALASGADRVGGWPNNEADDEARLEHLRLVFRLAERFGVPIDINIDYFSDPSERLLEPLAEMTIAAGMQGRVNANHVGALETYPDDEARRVIDRVATAGITVTVVPANLAGAQPYRGVSRPLELLDAGVDVAIGLGNHEDNWEFIGTVDPLERARFAWHALALGGLPGDGIDAAWRTITESAWRAVGRDTPRIEVGEPADLVLLSAPDRVQALRNEAATRRLLRGGVVVAERSVRSDVIY